MSEQKKPFSFTVSDDDFKKSSFSNPLCLGGCVSVAIKPQGVAVRDTKDATKTTLYYTPTEWKAFLDGVRNQEFG